MHQGGGSPHVGRGLCRDEQAARRETVFELQGSRDLKSYRCAHTVTEQSDRYVTHRYQRSRDFGGEFGHIIDKRIVDAIFTAWVLHGADLDVPAHLLHPRMEETGAAAGVWETDQSPCGTGRDLPESQPSVSAPAHGLERPAARFA